MKLFFYCVIATLLVGDLCAQDTIPMRRTDKIPVLNDEGPLNFAWSGGLLKPLFSTADLDNDGWDDLVIFERADNQYLTFLNLGIQGESSYEFAPRYVRNLPESIGWVLLRDFDCDGVKDLFTTRNPDLGLRVFRGEYNEANELTFEELPEEEVITEGFNFSFNSDALPAFDDVTGDGLMDIMDFQPNGGFMFLYENIGEECGDLHFAVTDSCWGHFFENGIEKEARLDTCIGMGTPQPIVGETGLEEGRSSIHAGSTILPIDLDGDMDKELLVGNLNFSHLLLLENAGTIEDAYVENQASNFPVNDVRVFVRQFPAAFYEDINNDGLRELLVSPFTLNDAVDPYFDAWMYQNVGTEQNVEFELQTRAFAIESSMDVSWYSQPSFFDYNGDGLLDLVIGNRSFYLEGEVEGQGIQGATLSLYENTGTANEAEFTLVEDNYLNLFNENIAENNLLSIRPTFGDLNGDGALDLILGLSGTIGSGAANGKLLYLPNASTQGQIASFPQIIPNYQGIDVGSNSTPVLYDVNKDGLLDLVIGSTTGKLRYYENEGTTTEALFVEKSDFWGKVSVGETAFDGFSNPYLFELAGYEGIQLMVGSKPGEIAHYLIDEEGMAQDSFKLVNASINGIAAGQYSSPALADLDGDTLPEMIVGNRRGGLFLYEIGEEEVDTPVVINELTHLDLEKLPFELSNMPFESNIMLKFNEECNNCKVQCLIFDLNGQIVWSDTFYCNTCLHNISTAHLPSGMFILSVIMEGQHHSAKVMIHSD